MRQGPCRITRGLAETWPIKCDGRCSICAFNPAERDRRLSEGQFIGGKLVFPPRRKKTTEVKNHE